MKSILLVWKNIYAMQHFSILYNDALVFNFFLILYSYKFYLLGSVPMNLSAGSTPCFLQLISARLWFVFQFNLSYASSIFCLAKVNCFYILQSLSLRLYTLFNFLFNYMIFSSIFSNWILGAFIVLLNLAQSFFIIIN